MSCSKRLGGSHFRAWGDHSGGRRGGRSRNWHSSGNAAFDEYRDATLKQLEEDQVEFANFLDNLRKAKDQREFDDFMADRMRRKTEENGREPRPDESAPTG